MWRFLAAKGERASTTLQTRQRSKESDVVTLSSAVASGDGCHEQLKVIGQTLTVGERASLL